MIYNNLNINKNKGLSRNILMKCKFQKVIKYFCSKRLKNIVQDLYNKRMEMMWSKIIIYHQMVSGFILRNILYIIFIKFIQILKKNISLIKNHQMRDKKNNSKQILNFKKINQLILIMANKKKKSSLMYYRIIRKLALLISFISLLNIFITRMK